jgi:D-proline reductase (dithiol) PrdB
VIEAAGIPTMVIGTALDIMSRVTPPRAAFVDHPVGRTFGPPHDRQRHETVLARALAELPHFTRPGAIRDLGSHWSPDGSRAWEDELRAEMLHDR